MFCWLVGPAFDGKLFHFPGQKSDFVFRRPSQEVAAGTREGTGGST